MSVSNLPRAPGASTAKTTGILSIVLGILCLPVGLVLAIVALVQHHKAKSAYAANPGDYQPVGKVGLVTAILGLVIPLTLAMIGMAAGMVKMNGKSVTTNVQPLH
jgi:chromate transport protein ChrA